jgi:hypothetical protein
MKLTCPKCGGQNVRFAYIRTPAERLASFVGIRPIRCRDCRTRFATKLWKPADMVYARCPRCWNLKLSTWSPSQYRVPPGKGILMFFGANPYRCERCRHNFVSFRPRKFRYRRGHRTVAVEQREEFFQD